MLAGATVVQLALAAEVAHRTVGIIRDSDVSLV